MAKKTRKKAAAKAGRPSGRGLGAVSLEDLAREMRRRQGAVGRLVKRRDRLVAQVHELNAEIQKLGGAAGAGGFGTTAAGRPRRRPQNDSNLSDALLGVLKNATLSVTEAAAAVQEAGYQTTSANFRTIVNQTLLKDPRFKKVSRGKYTAK